MQRYGELLMQALRRLEVPVRLVRPEPMLSRWFPARSRAFRWAGFLDKFLLFPLYLLWVAHWPGRSRPRLVHVLDQGNGVYLPLIRHRPHLLTLHDLIAVRAGTGQHSTHPAPRFSPYQWINALCLRRSRHLLCVSAATRNDAMALWQLPAERLLLLPNPVDPFFLVPDPRRHAALPARYWLHAGTGAWYKNRLMVLRIHAELLAQGLRIPLLLIGEPLQRQEADLLESLGSGEWVTAISNVDDSLIRSAYAHAEGLIFPSLEEGFGWPVLEAMAQGCPVYCSNRPPLTELVGDAGVLIDPLDPIAAAAAIAADGRDPAARTQRLERGRLLAARHGLKTYGTELSALYIALSELPP
jgi:glycosyltransferase involved in cell wall biosynthesis